jgi:hypothetical protein
LANELWQNIDTKDLMAKFNKLVGFKRLSYSRMDELEAILKETSVLLTELRKFDDL